MILDDLATMLNINGSTKHTYSILNLNNKGIHIEGAVLIKNCTSVRIDLLIAKSPITILGENLKIKNLCLGSVTILGEIWGCVDRIKLKI